MSVRDLPSDGVRVPTDLRSRAPSPSRHDLLLAAIPTLVLLGFLIDRVVMLPLVEGEAVGSMLAALLVGYALFVETPGVPPAGRENEGQ